MGIVSMKKIIILHGWTKNMDKWQHFIEIMKEKKADVKLLKIPGLTEKLNEVWKIDDYVAWLNKIIGKDKATLVGHSNGGRISLAFANKYPEKLNKLILIDSAGIYHNEFPIRAKRLIFKTIAKLGKKIISSENFKNMLYKFARESDYKDLDENIKQTMINLISTDLRPILPQISIPTLIIWGGDDKITPLSDGLMMNRLIENSKLEVISEARHSPMFTHPEIVAKTIYEYL